jgi:hypothetical protein
VLYRLKWTVSQGEETKIHEYVTALKSAWELWYWLTTRAEMESEYHKRMVEQKRESALFSASYVPPIVTVNVYEIGGAEVTPEEGLAGMHRQKIGSRYEG